MNSHEVYIGKINNEYKYIGSGKIGRHKHLNSGTSSVYQANKLHFDGGCLSVEVIYYDSKQEALAKEIELIKTYQPEWNVVYTKLSKTTGQLKWDTNKWKKRALESDRWFCKVSLEILERINPSGKVFVPSSVLKDYSANLYNHRFNKSTKTITDLIPFVKTVSLADAKYEFSICMETIANTERLSQWRVRG